MARHSLRVLAHTALIAACAGRSQSHVGPSAAQPLALQTPTFRLPTVEPATLDSLHAFLGRIARDRSLLSALDPSQPRMYALFRELEAAQRAFETALATPDSRGRTLYDRLLETTGPADSVFRQLEAFHRTLSRP